MKDFKILSAKVALPVLSVVPIRGFLPPAVIVVGVDLNQADQIFYNDIQVDQYFVQSSTQIIVAIPDSQIGRDLFNISVISNVPVPSKNSTLSLEINRPIKTISGIERLVQSWLIIFMTNPGSDIFSPQSGGGGRAILGKPTDSMHKSASADLSLAIDKVKTELMSAQSQDSRIPPAETLLSADLSDISYDPYTGILSATVLITNMLGQSGEVSVG